MVRKSEILASFPLIAHIDPILRKAFVFCAMYTVAI